MELLDLSIRDIIEMIVELFHKYEKIISFLFGGCGVGVLVFILSKIKLAGAGVGEIVLNVKEKGLYNYNDIVKKLRIQKIIDSDFSEYSDYLFLQYGSSVNPQNYKPNDFDFIVLLLGHPKENKKHIHSKGNYPLKGEDVKFTNVDIVFRDYLSFLFAASSGMPYENSIIANSKLLRGHRGYYQWLKNITMNIMIDKDFLVRRFDDKLIQERQTYENQKKYHSDIKYDIIRAGYYYITTIIQKETIMDFPKVIFQDDVIPLANVKALGEQYFEDEIIRGKYMNLLRCLKRIDVNDNQINVEEIDDILKSIYENGE